MAKSSHSGSLERRLDSLNIIDRELIEQREQHTICHDKYFARLFMCDNTHTPCTETQEINSGWNKERQALQNVVNDNEFRTCSLDAAQRLQRPD